ncbi:MAG TPA: hypothetical protein VM657_00080 [Sphingomonas sp.]|nr:hypothetical protein [Sphingomonas sp.]
MCKDTEDIPPDAGKRSPIMAREPPLGEIGSGPGYSGQEYDSAGQAEWRAREQARSVPRDGTVEGSGIGAGGGQEGEDYDLDDAGGGSLPGSGEG